MKQRLIGVVGPTATGKTALGVGLAKCLNGEIVSADSMQLYRGIHIASAAPDAAEMQGIPHHLIEVLSCTESCTVADYAENARKTVSQIAERGRQPIVVGGTGLYVNALFDHTQFVPQVSDPAVRSHLEQEYDALGGEEMWVRLRMTDPETAARVHPNDKRRIVRALEVFATTGQTQSQANRVSHDEESPYEPILIGLTFHDREVLYDRINRRVDLMMEAGLLAEAKTTFKKPLGHGMSQAIGHKELYPFLRGEIPLEEAVENLKQATRRYAKRQLTWFRRDTRIGWIEVDRTPDVLACALKMIAERKEEKF